MHISQFKGLIYVSNYWKWKDKERAKLRKEMLIQFKLEHRSIIGSYLELWILDFSLVYMVRKLGHRPKTFMRVQDSILPFWSPNLSIKREVQICPATQTLFSVQSISRVLEVQMSSFFFWWKADTDSNNFHEDYLLKFWC